MHIDTPIFYSKYRLGLMLMIVVVLAILAKALHFGLWQWFVFALTTAFVLAWDYFNHRLLHLVSSDTLWQCLVRTQRQDELWQMEVVKLSNRGLAVSIEAWVVEPSQHSLCLMIYPDMMNKDDFRKLRAMARF